MLDQFTRRGFLAKAPAAGAAIAAVSAAAPIEKPALLGGPKAKKVAFESWPKFDFTEEKALLDVLRTGKWNRSGGQFVKRFEASYAALTGAKHVLATSNGTASLYIALNVLGVDAGDE